jgi:hypothetical protein
MQLGVTPTPPLGRPQGYELDIETRSGRPYKQSDLRRAAAHHARLILVLDPCAPADAPAADGGEAARLARRGMSDAQSAKAATLMCLAALGQRRGQRVVVEVLGEVPRGADALASMAAANPIRGGTVLNLPGGSFVHRLLALTAVQPGAAAAGAPARR